MHVMMLGINHRTAGVELRERLAISGTQLDSVVEQLRERFPAAEVVILSTCNRTELYIARPSRAAPSVDQVKAYLIEMSGLDPEVVGGALVDLRNEQAVNHVFRVACGLESMVLGEPQVLGQVKRAYEAAHGRGVVGPVLHQVFQRAIRVAKRVRTQTGIASGRVSIGSVAVDFAKQIFERFDDKTIVGIGAGELAKPMLGYLKRLRPAKLWVANRSPDKAQVIASKLGLGGEAGGARPYEELDELLVEADIVLTSTGASQPIVTAERFKPVWRRRRHRPLFMIDTAVPRDVEPAVGEFENVYLYNLDDLQRVVERTHGRREGLVEVCEAMLTEAVSSCMSQVQNRDIGQLVSALRKHLHDIGLAEQQRTMRKLAAGGAEGLTHELIEEHTQRLINKVLHLPLSQLDSRKPASSLGFYAAALRELFGLDQQQTSLTQVETDGPSADSSSEGLRVEINDTPPRTTPVRERA